VIVNVHVKRATIPRLRGATAGRGWYDTTSLNRPATECLPVPIMLAYVWPFLIYWLILFVACSVVTEYGQTYLYDETTPRVGLKLLLGTMILAALMTRTRTSYDTMLTSELGWTVIQAIVWFGVFTLILHFQPWHGGIIGIVTMLLVAGIATLGVDSLTGSNRQGALPTNVRPSRPLRRSVGVPPQVPADAAEKPAPAAK
jgi:peptidoglycan/LPS O-acetylase OafA/YrhL